MFTMFISTKVFLSCCGSILAFKDRSLTLLEPHDDVATDAHAWELSYSSHPYGNDDDSYWILRYLTAECQIELRPGKREMVCRGALGAPHGSAECALHVVPQRRLRFVQASTGAQLALEVTGDDGNNAVPVFVRAVAGGEGVEARSAVDVFYMYALSGARFDYIVVGSSFCSWALVKIIRRHNPTARFLILEKGSVDLFQHQQSLPSRGDDKTASKMARRPWSVSDRTSHSQYITNIHGQIQYVGGRSTYWSGWCPEPSEAELEGWPEALKKTLRPYFAKARESLGVIPASKVKGEDSLYGPLQDFLQDSCKLARAIDSVTEIFPAPLAVGNKGYEKFSTPNPMKEITSANVQTIVRCSVEKIIYDGKKATHLQTSLGVLPLHNAKLILAMSTLPSTTLVLNSFGKGEFPFLANVGKRLTAHFVSSAVARVPRNRLPVPSAGQGVQLGAVYISGKAQAQYHLQMSAVATSNPESRDLELCRQFSANSISEGCIKASPEHVLVSCSALGELDHTNKDNWFRLKEGTQSDLTSNGELQIVPNDQDLTLWDTMDDVMFKTIESCLSSSPGDKVEYLHDENKGVWKTERPTKESMRQKNAVHDASTMWMGGDGDEEAPVGLDYRLQGVENVFITGGALWPTGGSWNPVLTIVAMAMHLADCLCNSEDVKSG